MKIKINHNIIDQRFDRCLNLVSPVDHIKILLQFWKLKDN